MNNNSTNAASLASKFINHSNRHIFLTGKAGTGKTTFLRHIIASTHKKAVIVAPTGIAAINAGGVTIHSLFQLPFGGFIPVNQSQNDLKQVRLTDPGSLMRGMHMGEKKRRLLQELELLIIDEVSMLRADLLDAMDTVLRSIRRIPLAFGGVQVLFIGDLLQLPPVVKEEEWNVLKKYYASAFFFDARVLKENKPLYIELEKIYRQDDEVFIGLLNNLRNNAVSTNDVTLLNTYFKPDFKPGATENYITLTTHNYKADRINAEYLSMIKTQEFRYEAQIEGEFSEYAYPIEKSLLLKLNAQVMFVKNDPTGAQRFFNGKIGKIISLEKHSIVVGFDDGSAPVKVEQYAWQHMKYSLDPETNEIAEQVAGTFTQYPLKLAWAITVHKSQGLTFDKAIIDIGDAFAPGQVYVALSRLRSLNGLVMTSRLNYSSMIQHASVAEFSKSRSAQEELTLLVEQEETSYLKNYLLDCFDLTGMLNAFQAHASSYTRDEKRSVKQQHAGWAETLYKSLVAIKEPYKKFQSEIQGYFISGKVAIVQLEERIKSAAGYFSSQLQICSDSILQHVQTIKSEKKVKIYLEELLDLESKVFEQIKRMKRASALAKAILEKGELTKEKIKNSAEEAARSEKLRQAVSLESKEKIIQLVSLAENTVSIAEGKKDKLKRPKEDTKLISYNLYKSGKSVAQIAEERKLVASTIEAHLAHYVTRGELPVSDFVEKDKMEKIISTFLELDTFQLGPVKSALGEVVTYSEIRFALAGHLSVQASQP